MEKDFRAESWQFVGELTAQVRISEFLPTAKPGSKTSQFVALSHATDSLVSVPGFAVGTNSDIVT